MQIHCSVSRTIMVNGRFYDFVDRDCEVDRPEDLAYFLGDPDYSVVEEVVPILEPLPLLPKGSKIKVEKVDVADLVEKEETLLNKTSSPSPS